MLRANWDFVFYRLQIQNGLVNWKIRKEHLRHIHEPEL